MWDVFANQSENFDSFATHSLLSLVVGNENCLVQQNWNVSIGWLANFEREKNADW